MLKTLSKARSDKDEVVRVFAQVSERILKKLPSNQSISFGTADSIINQCLRQIMGGRGEIK